MGDGKVLNLNLMHCESEMYVFFHWQSRQEVCESVEWFRSYQGGVYHKDGSVKGYLLSGHPAE